MYPHDIIPVYLPFQDYLLMSHPTSFSVPCCPSPNTLSLVSSQPHLEESPKGSWVHLFMWVIPMSIFQMSSLTKQSQEPSPSDTSQHLGQIYSPLKSSCMILFFMSICRLRANRHEFKSLTMAGICVCLSHSHAPVTGTTLGI